jgi:hypothetical protein
MTIRRQVLHCRMADEPLRTTTFTLTRADALAYEQAASRMTPLGVIALVCWLGLGGASALLIPPKWTGPWPGLSSSVLVSIAMAIAYVLALLLIAMLQWLRARRRVRRAADMTVGEWPDRLDLLSTGMPRSIALNDVRRSILTSTHLFLEADGEVLILPRRAFPEEDAVEQLARRAGVPAGPGAVDAMPPSA